jgi:hypothetical protein
LAIGLHDIAQTARRVANPPQDAILPHKAAKRNQSAGDKITSGTFIAGCKEFEV